MLDVESDHSGILIPRVALTSIDQSTPVVSPQVSELVYNTATAGTAPNNVSPGYYYWNGSQWVRLSSGGATVSNEAWELSGNAGTTAGTNFIGTTDHQALHFKINSQDRLIMPLTNQILAAQGGNRNAPFYSFAHTPNMGIAAPSPNTLQLITDGAVRFIVTKELIRSDLHHRFQEGTVDKPGIAFEKSSGTGISRPETNQMGLSTNSLERIRIDRDGRVGIGTSEPNKYAGVDNIIHKLNVRGTSTHNSTTGDFTPMSVFDNTGTGAALGVFSNNQSVSLEVGNKGSRGIAIRGIHEGAGDGIGVFGYSNIANGWAGLFNGSVGATDNFYIASDRNLKTNINDLDGDDILKKIGKIKPKSYHLITDIHSGMGGERKKSFGFIAQELMEVFPELVVHKGIPNPLGKKEALKNPEFSNYYLVNYTGLIPILTEAIQKQQEKIEALERQVEKIETLENKIRELEILIRSR